MVRYPDATVSSFFAKVHGEVFANSHAVAVKSHSSMRNRTPNCDFLDVNPAPNTYPGCLQ
jgi:hypothetical protein